MYTLQIEQYKVFKTKIERKHIFKINVLVVGLSKHHKKYLTLSKDASNM